MTIGALAGLAYDVPKEWLQYGQWKRGTLKSLFVCLRLECTKQD
jgi:hypothetical protein